MAAIRSPGFSVEIALHHGNEVVCRRLLGWAGFLRGVEHVIAQVAFDQLRHESIQCAATGSNELQDLFALVFFPSERSFNGFDLALNTADPAQHLFFVFAGVGQADLLQRVIYSPRVYVKIERDEETCWRRSDE